ncbi:MAG TPA: serine hydrolase domain-containing protein [Acidimicrobiales bacterium]|nr:serine hydrolase domain-containing protein [Acidimicrobiales bacterium]
MTEIHGTVADGFEPVRDAFEANFAEHGDVGAGFSLYVEGECVVDLTGGVADPATGRPYDDQTLQLVFSTTKGAAAICGHLLAQRGLLDFDAPVASVWPEFAAEGKGDVPIRWLFSHRTGLPVIDSQLTREQILAWDPVVEALAAQKPLWEPGTAHGYHALTYGWLVGEVVRRIDGRSIGQFFADEIADPLGLDFWIGLPDSEQSRCSPMLAADMSGRGLDMANMDPDMLALLPELAAMYLDPNSVALRALHLNGAFGLDGPEMPWNLAEVRAAQIPAANGVTNARSLAKLYASCVSEVDGIRLLDDAALDVALVEQSNGRDQTLVVPTRFGLGFFLPSNFSPLLGTNSFGHAGAGGSLGAADRDRRIGYGYVMNQMGNNLSGDPRTIGLTEAIDACL